MATPPSQHSQPTTDDYVSWDSPSLISRIRALESSLEEARSQISAPKPLLRPRKPPRPFDSSRYSTRLIALKFAYIGTHYGGYEYHGNDTALPTVEEVLFSALLKARLVPALADATDPESPEAWPGDEAVEYSKCGRTDRGVSAFGQVVGVRVRSNKPVPRDGEAPKQWDDLLDEMPYPAILNRLLPTTIRVLSWAPGLPPGFSARFNCRARHYRYYFTNPMLSPHSPGATLSLDAMRRATRYFEGTHDFRNFCKLDASKQIENFSRHIMHASIVHASSGALAETYYFDLRGSAFLWHQVRHMMAVLFLVGQEHEKPEIVRDMLDLAIFPTKPGYEMAEDRPLVLWDCVFPDDELKWVSTDNDNTRGALADTMWTRWHEKKIDETLAGELLGLVQSPTKREDAESIVLDGDAKVHGTLRIKRKKQRQKEGHVLILGTGEPVLRGKYIKMVDRKRMRPVEEINASYLERKGDWRARRQKKLKTSSEGGADEMVE